MRFRAYSLAARRLLIVEHLLEYQDYLLAYRLRALIGGPLRPHSKPLLLSEYAEHRLERQRLARELLGTKDYHNRMRRVDALTDKLNFGFWHNPNETVKVLRHVIEQGGCKALESSKDFTAELLTRLERASLKPNEETLIASYYMGLFRASAAYLDAEVFTRLRGEVEPLRDKLPIFVLPSGADVTPA